MSKRRDRDGSGGIPQWVTAAIVILAAVFGLFSTNARITTMDARQTVQANRLEHQGQRIDQNEMKLRRQDQQIDRQRVEIEANRESLQRLHQKQDELLGLFKEAVEGNDP